MFIVVNIGCIECGVSSDIVGVFASEERANGIADACEKEYSWREGGQNSFEVFPMPEAEIVNAAYTLPERDVTPKTLALPEGAS